jgi:hypothetical protein
MGNSERFCLGTLIGHMSTHGTCSAEVPGIANHHIKGKYMYVHSEEFKSSNQLERI